ncbi:unnamed protein product [Bursaphelenchus xylophilus]|uniref:(pine wood nematode) hypothetical protein n=1 Tax=Bursaphelenchus xylophilus TaxID=6326 RepID=A0A7I8WY83_BURXY|nr:unnamed protein product [Bursaphelenchus xylophilus]CAG9101211.1 unnamed protein product [Bursaphelenchus xylophilus]
MFPEVPNPRILRNEELKPAPWDFKRIWNNYWRLNMVITDLKEVAHSRLEVIETREWRRPGSVEYVNQLPNLDIA